jgi:MoxR-like ATPase
MTVNGAGLADLGPRDLLGALEDHGYIGDVGLSTVLTIALRLRRPLLLEGEAGVGKTELAKTVAAIGERRLIRLQCYEGIDAANALYDWDYARQMLHIRVLEGHDGAPATTAELFGPDFLIRRPLLDALDNDDAQPPVLLIDEIDRADDEFEAFLLELLSDFQVTIPEIGTIRAASAPIIILTSNRTRDLHDALKRRCLYHWLDHPNLEREIAILRRRVPEASAALTRDAALFVETLRRQGLTKPPGIAETIDWVQALTVLDHDELGVEVIERTLGALVKRHEDLETIGHAGIPELLAALDETGRHT